MIGTAQKKDTAVIKAIAAEAYDAVINARQILPFTSRPGGLSDADAARVAPLLRQLYERAGFTVIGRKVGFTNRTIWAQYNVHAPHWSYVFDRTVRDLTAAPLPLAPFAEPRIEPEIVFGLSAAPSPRMDEAALMACVEWVALGYEIVQSVFPDWKFAAADPSTTNGMHGALLIGPRHAAAPRAAEWLRTLARFDIDLLCDGKLIDRGSASNVMDGPLSVLHHLAELLAADPDSPPLAAGDIVTTGTLTKAMPIAPGETWTAVPRGVALDPIGLRFV
ncbi:MAG TPA: fumarylacetoacetate hydrolase family protein [Pseudolabrys sp.]|nr:fumarylacetoacetate hydrolase family protein [Pseudolabrys sp.]